MGTVSLRDIFTDYNADGFRESFREFLGYFVKQFYPGVNTQIEKLYFARFEYPLIVFPFYLLAVLTLWRFWKNPTPGRAALAGGAAGVLFYAYFHLWVYWSVVLMLLFACTLVFWRYDQARVRGFLVLIAVAMLIAVPYVLNYVEFARSAGADEYALRLGVSEGRALALRYLGFDYLFYLGLAAVVSWLYLVRWPDRAKAAFFLVLIASMFAVWNIQLVTGFVPFPMHWDRIISPMTFLIIAVVLSDAVGRLVQRRPAWGRIVLFLVLALTISAFAKKVVNVVEIRNSPQPWVLSKYRFPPEVADSWQWINANLGGEPKIISSSFMSAHFLTVYTSARPYLALWFFAPVTNGLIEERYLKASKLFGVSESTLASALGGDSPPACSGNFCFDAAENFQKTPYYLLGYYFRRGAVNEYFVQSGDVPPSYREELVGRYRRIRAGWEDVDAEYVYVGPWERQFSQPDFKDDPALVLIYQNPLVEIYKIRQP